MKNFLIIIFIILLSGYLSAKTNTKNLDKKTIDEETMSFWEKTLSYGTTGQKKSIVKYIRARECLEGQKLILKFLSNEKDNKVKQLMISTLVYFTNKQVIPFLLEIVKNDNDNNEELKRLAISSLGELKYKDTYKYIRKYLDSENDMLAETTLRTLGETEAKSIIDELLKRLKIEERENIRTQLILAIANIKSKKSQESLISIFTNQEEKELNRGFAATGLGYIKNKRSYDLLTKYYDLGAINIKMRIIDALGNLGYKESIDLLIESVKNDNKNVRIFGIRSLGKLKAKQAIDIIKYKKDFDPEYKVRLEAEKVLKTLTGE